MRRSALPLLSLPLVLVSLHVAADVPAVPGLGAAEQALLQQGKVVVQPEVFNTPDGKRAARGKAYVVVRAPPAACWAVMTDYSKFNEFMPRLKRVEVLQKSETAWKVRQTLSVPLSTVQYTLDLKFNGEARRMDWTIDPAAKNDIKDTAGSWEFLPRGDENTTLVRYIIGVETGRFVPGFLEDYLVKKDLPEVLNAFRQRVESGGKWKKD